MYKLGFIGAGNMGSALIKAASKKIGGRNIIITDVDSNKVKSLCEDTGCVSGSSLDVIVNCEYLFIAIKPQYLTSIYDVINDAKLKVKELPIFVTMLAGTSIDKFRKTLDINSPVIRIMPNVACSVGKGIVLCSHDGNVPQNKVDEFIDIMSLCGYTDIIPEHLIDAASSVTGCGPAYVFVMAEAMADGLVACGIPRDKAYNYASYLLSGSAELMICSDKSPSALKDSVCSPAGTTIEGVRELEKNGFRSAVIEAVIASYKKNKEM